jgi:hypothetical protein
MSTDHTVRKQTVVAERRISSKRNFTCSRWLNGGLRVEKKVNWREEYEKYDGVPIPILDPKMMVKVNDALAHMERVDLASLISLAWSNRKDELEEEVGRYFATPKSFCKYMGHWIAAFKEIHSEGAVLGLCVVN